MDAETARLLSEVNDLKSRIFTLERLINYYMPTVIEVDVPNQDPESEDPPKKKRVAILGVLMSDVDGSTWTPFEDCDGNTFKVQTRNFTAAP